ncbi:unnamed protein product [Ostreobium quekettii]|uniref:Uncharacterized protein n=1 Tax=Ostreobium quekettii TaxID=121088 RepID=A0A8S1JEY4_9CHLO|nr:unnamed protein product [Ostreobium quekettii]
MNSTTEFQRRYTMAWICMMLFQQGKYEAAVGIVWCLSTMVISDGAVPLICAPTPWQELPLKTEKNQRSVGLKLVNIDPIVTAHVCVSMARLRVRMCTEAGKMSFVGWALSSGLLTKPLPVLAAASGMRKKVLHDPFLSNLALVLSHRGKYEQAERLHRERQDMMKKVLGEVHPDDGSSLNNLALVPSKQGKYEEAETLHRVALELRRKVLGEIHPDVAISLNNLALVLSKQGKYKEAEMLHRGELELRRKVLGKVHPDIATSLNSLALVLCKQEGYKAEKLHRDGLKMRRMVFWEVFCGAGGSAHFNLGLALEGKKEYKPLNPYDRYALEMTKTVLGEGHQSIAAAGDNLELAAQQPHRRVGMTLLYAHPIIATYLSDFATRQMSRKYEETGKVRREGLEVSNEILNKGGTLDPPAGSVRIEALPDIDGQNLLRTRDSHAAEGHDIPDEGEQCGFPNREKKPPRSRMALGQNALNICASRGSFSSSLSMAACVVFAITFATAAAAYSDVNSPMQGNVTWSAAPRGRFPYLVSVRDGFKGHSCDGVLTHPHYVMIDAHCAEVVGPNPVMFFYSTVTEEGAAKIKEVRAEGVLFHPNITEVALFLLLEPVGGNVAVAQAAPPFPNAVLVTAAEGSDVFVTPWDCGDDVRGSECMRILAKVPNCSEGPKFRQYSLVVLDPPPSAAGFKSRDTNLDLMVGMVSSWDGDVTFVDLNRSDIRRWLEDVKAQMEPMQRKRRDHILALVISSVSLGYSVC